MAFDLLLFLSPSDPSLAKGKMKKEQVNVVQHHRSFKGITKVLWSQEKGGGQRAQKPRVFSGLGLWGIRGDMTRQLRQSGWEGCLYSTKLIGEVLIIMDSLTSVQFGSETISVRLIFAWETILTKPVRNWVTCLGSCIGPPFCVAQITSLFNMLAVVKKSLKH